MGHDLCTTIMQLSEYRDCGVGSEGILCHYLLLILSNWEYSTEWLSELSPHIAHVSSISERLEQQQPLPSPAPKGKRTINGAVKQQSKGVFAAQGWSHKTELCPRLNKIVRKSQSTIKDMFFIWKSYLWPSSGILWSFNFVAQHPFLSCFGRRDVKALG